MTQQQTRRTWLRALSTLAGTATVVGLAPRAHAQAWPTKPIKLIVPYPPGGQTDIVSRFLGERLTPVFGHNVIVENRAGAQGIVGLEALKNAAPDGYTYGYVNSSNISLNPYLYEKLPYDPAKDFAPVTQLGLAALCMVVSPSLGPKTLNEFVAYAKANTGKISFASFGNGSSSHIYGEMLKNLAGIDMNHVPYKGAGPAVVDIVAGHAQTGIHDFASVGPSIMAGKLLALATTGSKRWPAFPDVPTFVEQGLALDLVGWNGIMAPAGTPRAIVERISTEINKIIQSTDGREQMLRYGLLATGTTPEGFAQIVRAENPR